MSSMRRDGDDDVAVALVLALAAPVTVINVIVIHDTYRLFSTLSRPSSRGSKTSIISTLSNELTWCNGNLRFKISAIVTALFIARPIAFSTTTS